MNKQLPLIALVTMGLAACGGADVDEPVEIEDDATIVTTEQPPLEGDSPMVDDDMDMNDDMAMNDPMMGDDTMMGGASDMATVTINNVQPTGTIYVGLQDASNFGTADVVTGTSVEPGMGDSVEAMLSGVTPGDYAVAVFQDTDGDGQLTLGANGIPSEPWALSNGAGTQGPPAFDDAMMTFDGMDDEAEVELSSM